MPSRLTPYLRILNRNAFGNFRTLLGEITLNVAMGRYLDMVTSTRTRPNENYPREILQLFSIGTMRLNPDGTVQSDADGPIPTYDQSVVDGFSKAFTGWTYPAQYPGGITNYIDPMVLVAGNHDTTAKAPPPRRHPSGGTDGDAGPERRPRQHLPGPERRAVHRRAAHPDARHVEPEPGVRRAGHRGLRRQRVGRPGRHEGRRPRDPPRPGGPRDGTGRPVLRPAAGARPLAHRLPASPRGEVGRRHGERGRLPEPANILRSGRAFSVPRPSSATSRPTTRRRGRAASSARNSASCRRPRRSAGRTSSTASSTTRRTVRSPGAPASRRTRIRTT